MKAENSKEFRQNNSKARPFYCKICSEVPMLDTGMLRAFYHRHHSSLMDRICMRELGMFWRYVCEPCGLDSEVHHVKFGARILVVLSSSTLHRPFKNTSRGQDIHVDWCTIPGGQVNMLVHAFRALYGKSCRPVDVLVVVGLNDIGKGRHNIQEVHAAQGNRLRNLSEAHNWPINLCHQDTAASSNLQWLQHRHPWASQRLQRSPTPPNQEDYRPQHQGSTLHRFPSQYEKGRSSTYMAWTWEWPRKSTLLRKVPSRNRMSQWREEESCTLWMQKRKRWRWLA